MKSLSENVATLVDRTPAPRSRRCHRSTETFQSFAEESAKEAPRAGTLRVLGKALIDASKKVAKVALPVAGAVAAVMQIFGIPGIVRHRHYENAITAAVS